jgi:histidine phosphotransferase ChpT
MQIDLRVLELLSSKICHDLISPVSAINNGVELIEDIGGSVVEEAMKLIGNSAVQSSRRLRVFRMAYGRAGSEANLPLRDLRQVAEHYFLDGKIKLVWPEDMDLPSLSEHRGAMKVLINMLILAEEMLAYGGKVSLMRLADEAAVGCRLQIEGRGVQLAPQYEEALKGATEVENLTPRTIQSYITGRFAEHFDLRIAGQGVKDECFEMTLSVPTQTYDQHQAD